MAMGTKQDFEDSVMLYSGTYIMECGYHATIQRDHYTYRGMLEIGKVTVPIMVKKLEEWLADDFKSDRSNPWMFISLIGDLRDDFRIPEEIQGQLKPIVEYTIAWFNSTN